MPATAEVKISLTDLEPVRKLLGDLALLHRKSEQTVEIEIWHEDDDGGCPAADGEGRGCNGHTENIHICDECGYGLDDYGEPIWLEWPCKTARLLGLSDRGPDDV